MHTMFTVKVYFFLIFVIASATPENCQQRTTKTGIVCVCDINHCDTIEEVKKIQAGKFVKYTSNKAGQRFEKLEGTINNNSSDQKQTTFKIEIEDIITYQEIFGFGGALTDSTCLNILNLNESLQEALLKSYYSKDGIEYNVGRIPMGSSDFSLHPYTYHDKEDMKLSNFTLQPEDTDLKIPMIKRAIDLNNELKLFVSTWTAPLWMKENGAYAGMDGFLKKNMYQVWADYFVKFLDAYKAENISFWGISTGNEPGTGLLPVKIPSVAWLSSQMRKWVSQNLGPNLRNSTHKDIKLIVLDDQRIRLPDYVNEVFENDLAENYIDGIGVHWYTDKFVSVDTLTETHELHPFKFILATEACGGFLGPPHVELGSWERGEDYAFSIIEDLNHWVVGWTDWNMALNMEGGPTYISNFVDSPIIVNAEQQEFYKQPMFYALGHFSKFIPRGSVRIDASHDHNSNIVLTAAKRPDGGKVVVILNKGAKEVLIDIKDRTVGSINIDVSGHSITTVLYWPN